MSVDNSPLLVEPRDGWVYLELNRPRSRNAINRQLAVALREAIVVADHDPDVRAIVIGGARGAFCAGLDLRAVSGSESEASATLIAVGDLHAALFATTTPLVAACDGYAINAGAALAIACDVLILGESSFIQLGEIRQGIGIPANAAWLRVRSTEVTAMRLALYGDRVPAAEAYRLGLATEVVPDDQVASRAAAVADRIASFPSAGPIAVKRSITATRAAESPGWFEAIERVGSMLGLPGLAET